jgi:hypothetical protein
MADIRRLRDPAGAHRLLELAEQQKSEIASQPLPDLARTIRDVEKHASVSTLFLGTVHSSPLNLRKEGARPGPKRASPTRRGAWLTLFSRFATDSSIDSTLNSAVAIPTSPSKTSVALADKAISLTLPPAKRLDMLMIEFDGECQLHFGILRVL